MWPALLSPPLCCMNTSSFHHTWFLYHRGWRIMLCYCYIYSLEGRIVRTAQMAYHSASTSGAVDLGLIPSRVKPMTLKIGVHGFPALTLSIKETVSRTSKFTCCAVGKNQLLHKVSENVLNFKGVWIKRVNPNPLIQILGESPHKQMNQST